jgi:hypothetical protein
MGRGTVCSYGPGVRSQRRILPRDRLLQISYFLTHGGNFLVDISGHGGSLLVRIVALEMVCLSENEHTQAVFLVPFRSTRAAAPAHSRPTAANLDQRCSGLACTPPRAPTKRLADNCLDCEVKARCCARRAWLGNQSPSCHLALSPVVFGTTQRKRPRSDRAPTTRAFGPTTLRSAVISSSPRTVDTALGTPSQLPCCPRHQRRRL